MTKHLADRTAVAFVHVAAALLAPASFWLLGRSEFLRLDLFSLSYGLLPLSGVTLAMAATRSQFWTGLSSELSVALLWLAAFVSLAIADRLYWWYGQAGVDGSAGLLAMSGGAMLFMTFRLWRVRHSRGAALPARIVYGIGVALFAAISLRKPQLLYLNTRVLESHGLEGVLRELRLRLWLSVAAVAALVGGRLLRRRLRGAEQAGVA